MNGTLAALCALLMQTIVCASDSVAKTENEINLLKSSTRDLSRHLQELQFYIEEHNRYDGDSGIKQIRQYRHSKDPVKSNSYAGNGYMNIHDHEQLKETIGMGEFAAVLNGVEFRTRHNDYKLVRPSDSDKYDKVEPIEFPEVPSSVTNKGSVEEQITEMRKYFEAWGKQDEKIADYKPYFQPVLCYLEGAWTNGSILESFDSDRHHIDADSFDDLFDKVQYSAYSGRNKAEENYAFLPRQIMGWNGTSPIFGQWNYRILCHKLKDNLPLNRFKLVSDLTQVINSKVTLKNTRDARFHLKTLKEDDIDKYSQLIDKLMGEIPGKDNYNGNLADTVYPDPVLNIDETVMNAAFYHRRFWTRIARNNKFKYSQRGFSDQNLFTALTTQNVIIGQNVSGQSQRWTFAIPLEIVYLTPLTKWNPYNLLHHDQNNKPRQVNRNGGNSVDKAFDGTSDRLFYRTPEDFFSVADTSSRTVHVLDPRGEVRAVTGSGHRVLLPMIEGAGILRQRYPIAPVYDEGNSIYKELEALKEVVQQLRTNT